MEKRRAGSTDCIKHSLDLFFDLASIFRRLLIILSQKVTVAFSPVKCFTTIFNHSSYLYYFQEERDQRKRKSN